MADEPQVQELTTVQVNPEDGQEQNLESGNVEPAVTVVLEPVSDAGQTESVGIETEQIEGSEEGAPEEVENGATENGTSVESAPENGEKNGVSKAENGGELKRKSLGEEDQPESDPIAEKKAKLTGDDGAAGDVEVIEDEGENGVVAN